MNGLLISNEVRMTSVDLCDLINKFREEEGNDTKKLHKTLMRDIRNEVETLENAGIINEHNFVPVDYTDAKGEQRPCYSLNRDGALQILNKESAVVRYKTIQYIDKLEEQKLPSYMIENPKERAKRWIEEYEEKEKLQLENKEHQKTIGEMSPKAKYFDDLVDKDLLLNFRDTAKELEIKQKDFIEFLINNKYIFRDNGGNLKPYSTSISKGFFKIREFVVNNHAGTQTLITPKGREYFNKKIKDISK